jgi:hypothetical protein
MFVSKIEYIQQEMMSNSFSLYRDYKQPESISGLMKRVYYLDKVGNWNFLIEDFWVRGISRGRRLIFHAYP